jgi:hypothetical protein
MPLHVLHRRTLHLPCEPPEARHLKPPPNPFVDPSVDLLAYVRAAVPATVIGHVSLSSRTARGVFAGTGGARGGGSLGPEGPEGPTADSCPAGGGGECDSPDSNARNVDLGICSYGRCAWKFHVSSSCHVVSHVVSHLVSHVVSH